MRYTIDVVCADGRELHWTFTTPTPEPKPFGEIEGFKPISLQLARRIDEDFDFPLLDLHPVSEE